MPLGIDALGVGVTPFLQFRLWLREGPVGERVLGAAGAAVLVGLVVLATIPVRDNDDGGVTGVVGTPAGGATAAAGAAPTQAPSGDAGAAPQASGAAPGTAGASGTSSTGGAVTAAGGETAENPCSGLTDSAPGITATEVHIDLSVVNLAGPVGNSTFNIRSDMHEIAEAVIDDINKSGGVACGRKLVVKQYDVNPIDPQDGQSKCLQMQQDRPFLVIDYAGFVTPASRTCLVQAKIPFFTSTSIGETELKSSYPYMFSALASSEKQVRDTVLGLNERGYFAPPKFQKVGLFLQGCDPHANSEIDTNLAKIGVKPNQISKFVLDCNIAAPPNQIGQAVLQHKLDGASHVILATSIANSQNYVRIAAQQGFHPAYGLSDFGSNMVASTAGNWDRAFDGSTGISSTRSGDINSGIRTAEGDTCDKILTSHGRPGVKSEVKDSTAFGMCDAFSLFRAAINKAGANPTRLSFIQGLSNIGLWKSAGFGDGVFDRQGKVTGGDFHRPLQWHADCTCWKALADFQRGF